MLPRAIDLGPESQIGSYRLIREIGRGGMGTVYEAQHSVLPRRAAIKIMHADLRKHPGMASRMVQEASILEDVRHPGIVRVFECNVLPDHRPWIAMELVPGESLASRLQRRKSMPADEVAALIANVADAMASVHIRGIVHRDLKPDNLLLPADEREFPVRVIDWGVARLGPHGRLTLEGLTPGTPIYMAPEQAMGKGGGPACDLYALGVIAYEALTGHPPFDGRTLAEVVAMHLASEPAPLAELCDAPSQLCALIHRLLAKQPSERLDSVSVQKLARAIALDLSSNAYDALEIERPSTHATAVPMRPWPETPEDEAVVVDPETLETGNTEMHAVVAKPRWTPPLGRTVVPKAEHDQIAGEIIVRR
ncbi:MAG: serine/threonine protein kinase [Deltaproteobacteria bacterium]|nr:serine/threonine protein kinase [Deltaproteobacteria bacterium]